MNKSTGNPFYERKGAEIRFCEVINSWVFMVSLFRTPTLCVFRYLKPQFQSCVLLLNKHPDIENSNECGWLYRSSEVNPDSDFDIIAAANEPWIAWTGEAVFGSQVNVKCTFCSDESDCSYQGKCKLRYVRI